MKQGIDCRGRAAAMLAALGLMASVMASACGATPQPPTPTALPEPTAAPAEMVARGKVVFVERACQSCHIIKGFDETVGVVGPDLTDLYTRSHDVVRSKEYKASQGKAATALAYVEESILDPNAYIVPQCPNGPCARDTMIQDFKSTLPPEDLDALLAYLVTLR